MNIIYKNYEPNQGLEEIQAKLYSMNNDRQVTGKDVLERFEREKIDPKTVLYAFTDDNKPLGYVQARDYPQMKQVHMGNPWTTPDCPEEVKDKLFNDLFDYMKSREVDLQLLMNTRNDPKLEAVAKKLGMKPDRNIISFECDLESIKNFDKSAYNYTIRKATAEDVEDINRCRNLAFQQDENTRNEQAIEQYHTMIKDGNFYLIYDQDLLIGACNSRIPTETETDTNLRVGPVFTLLKKEEGLVFLWENALKIAQEANWKKDHISIGFTDENDREMKILHSIARKAEKVNTRYIL